MAKRKTFYVSAAIFELPLSAYAIAVYCYLSFCADRQGSCFPSIATIAERCGMSRTTAKKAKQELKDAGLIRAEEAYVPCANGRRRQSANRYRLMNVPQKTTYGRETTAPRSCDDYPSGRETTAPRSYGDREINNNRTMIMGDVPSVSQYGEDGRTDGLRELEEIFDKVQLHLYEDRTFAQAVEQSIRQLFYAPYFRVDGRRVPRDEVRKRLSMLTIDHIDFVDRQLRERSEEVTHADRYLASCIYHAPVDCYVKSKREEY